MKFRRTYHHRFDMMVPTRDFDITELEHIQPPMQKCTSGTDISKLAYRSVSWHVVRVMVRLLVSRFRESEQGREACMDQEGT